MTKTPTRLSVTSEPSVPLSNVAVIIFETYRSHIQKITSLSQNGQKQENFEKLPTLTDKICQYLKQVQSTARCMTYDLFKESYFPRTREKLLFKNSPRNQEFP